MSGGAASDFNYGRDTLRGESCPECGRAMSIVESSSPPKAKAAAPLRVDCNAVVESKTRIASEEWALGELGRD